MSTPLARLLAMAYRQLVDDLHRRLAARGWSDVRPAFGFLLLALRDGPVSLRELVATTRPRWLAVMRRAMATTLWKFSTTRMLHEYTEMLYLPAAGVPVAEAASTPVVTEAG